MALAKHETGLEQRDAPVRQVQVVAVASVRPVLDVLDRLGEGALEVPEFGGEQDVLRVDRLFLLCVLHAQVYTARLAMFSIPGCCDACVASA